MQKPFIAWPQGLEILQRSLHISICLITISIIAGCGFIVQPMRIANDELKNIQTFDPNDYNIKIESTETADGAIEYNLGLKNPANFHIHLKQPTRIKYAPFARDATVKGKINNRSYPILFDTGSKSAVCITTAHVGENQLPVYPLELTDGKGLSRNVGIAMIYNMTVGDLKYCNLPAMYLSIHTEYHPFGIASIKLGESKRITLPLYLIRKFKYMVFDNIRKEIELSRDTAFVVDNPNEWKSYPLLFEDGLMFMHSTIEGVPVKLLIDTGSEAELFLSEICFNKIAEGNPNFDKAWKRNKIAFLPFAGGRAPIKSHYVKGLTFDGYTYSPLTVINVFKESRARELLEGIKRDGIIGFPFFKNTIMVLDFEQEKMWVKKERKSRFEK